MKSLILKIAYERFCSLGRDEEGAGLLLTLGIFMFMFMMCSSVYVLGDVVRQKIELQNAADAAAYSAGSVQADTLSRVATLNRAMAWTYVQMTRRQMDYITYRWLAHTLKIYNEDYQEAVSWNKHLGACRKHRRQGASTWWIGVSEHPSGYNHVHLNGIFTGLSDYIPQDILQSTPGGGSLGLGTNVPVSTVANALTASDALNFSRIESLPLSIVGNKLNIGAMNLALVDLVRQMPGRIDRTVEGVLKANLQTQDLSEFTYRLEQTQNPFVYFDTLSNTSKNEKIFIGHGEYYSPLIQTFKNETLEWRDIAAVGILPESVTALAPFVAGGLDQWFVRGDGNKRTDGKRGLQRCYKHWPEGPLSSIHPSKFLPFLPPSCINTEKLDQSLPSIGLYSEWQFASMAWGCPPLFKHIPVIPMFKCDHTSVANLSNYHPRITQVNQNCTLCPSNGDISIRGYTRIYGDDPAIYDKTFYVGAKAWPLIIQPQFFRREGALVVGVARRHLNPWSRLLQDAPTVSNGQRLGVLDAFAPSLSHLIAFSAARAGYKLMQDNDKEGL